MSENPCPRSRPSPGERVAIPARLAGAPTSAGLVIPYITVTHRDRTRPVWGQVDAARMRHVLHERRCQICGQRLDEVAVVMIRSSDYQRGVAVEPGCHPECAHYSRQACVLLSGKTDRFNPTSAGTPPVCGDPHCHCQFWTPQSPPETSTPRQGAPTEAWYEAWIHLHDYRIITVPADSRTPELTGIALRDTPFRRLRKVRDAAPDAEDRLPFDVLGLLVATHSLWVLLDQPGTD